MVLFNAARFNREKCGKLNAGHNVRSNVTGLICERSICSVCGMLDQKYAVIETEQYCAQG
jgi:hypothetical protein